MRIKLLIITILFLLTTKTVSAATIKINEFYSAGSTNSNPDWVEVYYNDVNITLYQLRDAVGNTKNLSTGNYDGNFATVDWSNRLNNDGDTIKLALIITPDSPVDQVTYGGSGDISAPNSQQSAGRNADGTGGWVLFSMPTKGYTNNTSLPSPTLIINPTPSPTPTSTPPSNSQSSSFTISNTPSQINSDQSFSVSFNLSLPDNPNANFYLKGAFKKSDSSNYFGQTKVSGNWIKNGSSYSTQYPVTTNSSGNLNGSLEIKPDSDDSGFTGSGDYIFKVGRYTSSGSGPTWSNEQTIKIVSIETDQGDTLTDTFPPTTNPSSSSLPLQTKSTIVPQSKSYEKVEYHIASVAAATASTTVSASDEGGVSVKNEKQINPFFWAGLIFIFAGVSSIGYIYIKKNEKIRIWFRR